LGAVTYVQKSGTPALIVSTNGLVTTSGALAQGTQPTAADGTVSDASGDGERSLHAQRHDAAIVPTAPSIIGLRRSPENEDPEHSRFRLLRTSSSHEPLGNDSIVTRIPVRRCRAIADAHVLETCAYSHAFWQTVNVPDSLQPALGQRTGTKTHLAYVGLAARTLVARKPDDMDAFSNQ